MFRGPTFGTQYVILHMTYQGHIQHKSQMPSQGTTINGPGEAGGNQEKKIRRPFWKKNLEGHSLRKNNFMEEVPGEKFILNFFLQPAHPRC